MGREFDEAALELHFVSAASGRVYSVCQKKVLEGELCSAGRNSWHVYTCSLEFAGSGTDIVQCIRFVHMLCAEGLLHM